MLSPDLVALAIGEPAGRKSPAMSDPKNVPGNGGTPKPEPLVHRCHCGAWGSYGHDVGTKEERWYCRAHDPCGGRGSSGLKTTLLS